MPAQLVFFLTAAFAWLPTSGIGGQQEIPAAELEQLRLSVADLGSDSFDVRQSAMLRIRESPWRSPELLQRLVDSSDPETAARIEQLITATELGMDAALSPELVRLVNAFHKGDEEQQYLVLADMNELGQTLLAMNLIQSVSDPYVREYLFEAVRDEGYLPAKTILDGSDSFGPEQLLRLDAIMTHPLMREFQGTSSVAYLDIRGKLQESIERSKAACETATASRDVRLWLIEMLAYDHQFDKALDAIGGLDAPEFERDARRQAVLKHSGNWPELASEFNEGRIRTRPEPVQWVQAALINRWSGADDRADTWKQRLADNGDKLSQAMNGYLHLCELSLPGIIDAAAEMRPGEAFQLLCSVQQFDKAFEICQAPTDPDACKLWYRRQLRTLGRKLSLASQENDQVATVEARDLFELLEAVAWQTGEFGDRKLCRYLYEQLCLRLNQSDGWQVSQWKRIVFSRICQLNLGEDIWYFAELLELTEDPEETLNGIFRDSQDEARIWLLLLETSEPDVIQRLKLVANLLRSPFGDATMQFDIDALIGATRQQAESFPPAWRAQVLNGLGETCRIHGRHDLQRECALEATHLGNADAARALFHRAFDEADWNSALHWAEACKSLEFTPHAFYLIASCYQKLGDAQSEEKYRVTADLIAPYSWKMLDSAQELRALGMDSMALSLGNRLLRPLSAQEDRGYWEHQNYADMLKTSDLKLSLQHWRQAELCWLDQSDDSNGGDAPRIQYLACQAAMTEAELALRNGDWEKTERLLLGCNDVFSASASTLLDRFLPLLEQSGHRELADRLFDASAARFESVLKRHPDSALHHNNFAWVCVRNDRYPHQRLLHARRAVELEPNNPYYLDTLAEVLFRAGESAEAIALEQRCIQLNPFSETYPRQLERFRAGQD
jgi:tetratricopeptide (TPR) repeat protein